MSPLPPRIERFDPATDDDATLAALHAFTCALRDDLTPGEPHTPLAEAVTAWRSLRATGDVETWLARDASGAVLARAQGMAMHEGVSRHLVKGSCDVLAAHRGRGLARAVIAPVLDWMRSTGRTSWVVNTFDDAGAGAAWLARSGAVRGLVTTMHQLDLATVDRAMLAAWAALAPGYVCEWREGPLADGELEAVGALQDVMHSAPMGDLRVAHEPRSPELLRRLEAAMAARGLERRLLLARDPHGTLAGFTEVLRQPHDARLVHQGDTGVLPEHRGHGLGRRLKAVMLERVLAEWPEARVVRTTNADMNAPMLSINRELGFRPWLATTVWQAERTDLERAIGTPTP
jgi:mycothiol synthase